MIIVADASPLVALALCDSLNLLEALFDEVKVTQAVFDEVTHKGKPAAAELTVFLKDKTVQVSLNQYIIGGDGLDEGELTSIVLYKQLDANYLLIDEKAGRKVAKANQVNIIGSLGVLIEAKKKGLVAEIKPGIEKLRESQIYFGDELLNYALTLVGE